MEKSIRVWAFGWADPSPVTMDMKLSASLRVVLSPINRNVYLEPRDSIASAVVAARVCGTIREVNGKPRAGREEGVEWKVCERDQDISTMLLEPQQPGKQMMQKQKLGRCCWRDAHTSRLPAHTVEHFSCKKKREE